MAGVTHTFVNPKADGGDTTITRPSDWNATHTVSSIAFATAKATLELDTALNFSPAAAAPITVAGTVNGFYQQTMQNKSNGTAASTDFVVTADTGTDAIKYADFGINGSGWTGSTWGAALDAYLYTDGGSSGIGSLVIGTGQVNTTINFQIGGGGAANKVGYYNANGLNGIDGPVTGMGRDYTGARAMYFQ